MVPAATLLAGRFKLDEPIGSGGFCDVWRATDTVLSRSVAVKLLHPCYADQAEALGRFKAEARHAGSLSHPNIARVYDYGEPAGGQPPYLVMELIDGPNLAGVLAGGPLGAARTMDVVAQAAAGLQAAHASGLVHRDVKPGNILFAPGSRLTRPRRAGQIIRLAPVLIGLDDGSHACRGHQHRHQRRAGTGQLRPRGGRSRPGG